MQMGQCPNCGKLSGFKRALGFGTFFMVVITCGLWLLVIPLYPARCINCGLMRRTAAIANFNTRFQQLSATSKAIVILLPIALVVGFGVFSSSQNTANAPQPPDSRPSVSASVSDQEPRAVNDVTEDHVLHLTPNLFGRGAISDGRTYSVALISEYQEQIPPATKLLVQGLILSRYEPDTVILADEKSPDKTLACTMTPEEFQEVSYLYRLGSPVQTFGKYGNASEGIPTMQNCTFADPTNSVVRPKSIQREAAPAPAKETSAQGTESPEFRWPTAGLPAEVAEVLSTPDLAPNTPGTSIELSLSTSDEKQKLVVSDDCGSGGCDWDLTDAASGRYLLQSGLGELHKTQNVTAGYYDLLVEAKDVLVLYQYQGDSYRPAKCYSRSDGLGSSAILSPCG